MKFRVFSEVLWGFEVYGFYFLGIIGILCVYCVVNLLCLLFVYVYL